MTEKPEKSTWRERRSILKLANEVFGDKRNARAWLRRPNVFLGDLEPGECMRTRKGAKVVETLLMRIQHGIIS